MAVAQAILNVWPDGCTFGLNMSRSKLEHTDKRFLGQTKVGDFTKDSMC